MKFFLRKPDCCSMSKPLESKYVLSCSEISLSNIFAIPDNWSIIIVDKFAVRFVSWRDYTYSNLKVIGKYARI